MDTTDEAAIAAKALDSQINLNKQVSNQIWWIAEEISTNLTNVKIFSNFTSLKNPKPNPNIASNTNPNPKPKPKLTKKTEELGISKLLRFPLRVHCRQA